MTNPIALYGFLTPRPEHAQTVKDILTGLVEPTRAEPGNLAYHLHEHPDGRLFLYELWLSRDDLDRHNRNPDLQRFLANLDTYLSAPLEAYFDTMISRYTTD